MSDPFGFAADALDALDARARRRIVRPMQTATGTTVTRDGRRLLLFASNDYLGLATHPKVTAASADAALRWGAGTGSARLISGGLELHDELERAIADLKGTEDAVLFGSGYLANLGALTALAGPGDLIISDALNHASLIDGIRLSGAHRHVSAHRDVGDVARILRTHGSLARRLIVTDGVFSMDGDLAPIEDLETLAEAHGAILFIDDAHGTGVVGADGRGTATTSASVITMGTLSKALGAHGGFIAGPRTVCEYLRNTARTYIFDTAMPAPVAAAGLAAIQVLRSEPQRVERLRTNVRRLAEGLRARDITVEDPAAAIIPILVGDNTAALDAARTLEERGFLVPAIRPPSVPEGTARLRVTVTSEHTTDQIDQLVLALAEVLG